MEKIRLFEIMQDEDKIDLANCFAWLDNIACKYLCVLHDKDKTRPHYHIFVKMEGARSFDDIAKQCGVPMQYIERGKNFDNMLGYAFHLTKSAKESEKYLYDKSAIVRFRDIIVDDIFEKARQIDIKAQHDEDIKNLLFEYGALKATKTDVIRRLSPQDFAKHNKLFKQMQDYRTLQVKDRNMQVVYITGSAGAGKTTLAKFMARSFNYDVFVSGSGKDILDGYDKEECIILDDLRADVFTKAELFKLTDNNTNSSVKSRYNNKDISNCKLLIITSIKAPHKLYNWQEDSEESFLQFARRLAYTYVIIKNANVYTVKYDAMSLREMTFEKGARVDEAPYNMNDVFALLGIQKILHDETITAINSAILKEIELQRKEQEKQLTIDSLFNDTDEI